jgi:excisionase family DNA binding protein
MPTNERLSPRLLRTPAAAAYLSVSQWKVRQLVVQGKLAVMQDAEGSPFLFDVNDLDDFIERYKRVGRHKN